jgi:dTDP-4-dehydrorhamnose 3,5-epimerase-like enzyme
VSATTLTHCRTINLPRIERPQGNLTAIATGAEVPFPLARVYYLYDIPGGEARGGHAHRDLQQLIVAVRGSFDVVLDDGRERRSVRLDRAYKGLYLPRMIWRELENFSSGGICVVLASAPYDEDDYIRDYSTFRREKHDVLG